MLNLVSSSRKVLEKEKLDTNKREKEKGSRVSGHVRTLQCSSRMRERERKREPKVRESEIWFENEK